jgi:hypothetical protein
MSMIEHFGWHGLGSVPEGAQLRLLKNGNAAQIQLYPQAGDIAIGP